MESKINYGITIEGNDENCGVTFSPNATLHVDVETIIMHDLRYGQKFSLTENNVEYRIREKENIDFKTPIDTLEFRHERNVNPNDVNNIISQELMPGFQFNWYYSGVEVNADKHFSNKAFVRNISKILRFKILKG